MYAVMVVPDDDVWSLIGCSSVGWKGLVLVRQMCYNSRLLQMGSNEGLDKTEQSGACLSSNLRSMRASSHLLRMCFSVWVGNYRVCTERKLELTSVPESKVCIRWKRINSSIVSKPHLSVREGRDDLSPVYVRSQSIQKTMP